MQQVLFEVGGVPIYGFGTMLFLTFIVCTYLGVRWAKRAGIPPEKIQDLAIVLFVAGIIGARIVYMIQYERPLVEFFQIWKGGIVFYGSAAGALIGYLIFYRFVLRKHQISTWKLADIVAPIVCVGLAIGRVGCFLNGCCYGHVACPDCVQVHFPITTSPAQGELVGRDGLQTSLGFATLPDATVDPDGVAVAAVEPHSAAEDVGLRAGDRIVTANGIPADDLGRLLYDWPKGETELTLEIDRDGERITLPPFVPRTLGLYPTQLFETTSMVLLMLVLLAYYPLRKRDGELMVLLMFGYAIHRFINEQLRDDTDPVAMGLTLSQLGSVIIFTGGLVLGAYLRLTQKPVGAPLP